MGPGELCSMYIFILGMFRFIEWDTLFARCYYFSAKLWAWSAKLWAKKNPLLFLAASPK